MPLDGGSGGVRRRLRGRLRLPPSSVVSTEDGASAGAQKQAGGALEAAGAKVAPDLTAPPWAAQACRGDELGPGKARNGVRRLVLRCVIRAGTVELAMHKKCAQASVETLN